MGAGPAHAVYFGTYEIAKDFAGGNDDGYSFAATGQLRFAICSASQTTDLFMMLQLPLVR